MCCVIKIILYICIRIKNKTAMKNIAYNKSEIMKAAWKAVKSGIANLSTALATAWMYAKKAAKMSKVQISQAIYNLKNQDAKKFALRIDFYTNSIIELSSDMPQTVKIGYSLSADLNYKFQPTCK